MYNEHLVISSASSTDLFDAEIPNVRTIVVEHSRPETILYLAKVAPQCPNLHTVATKLVMRVTTPLCDNPVSTDSSFMASR
jgi:hypothetical protein